MHRTDHSRFRKQHDFVPDFSHAERRTRIVMGITAAMMVVEIVAGLMSHSMALLADGWHMSTHVLAFLITAESVHRLFAPLEIHFNEAIGIGCLGLLVNLGCAVLLADRHHEHADGSAHEHDLNLRAAYMHVLADAFTSVLAITALT